MQPIQDVTDARKTYTLYECEKCGSLRLERSGKPITKCAYCDNLSLKQRFLSALISIVHEATYKIPNPNNTGIVQNKADTKLPGSVVQVFVDNPETYCTTKIQLGTTSIDYSYDCTSGDIRIVAKNWDPFDLENADLGTGWHIRLLVQTWRNEIAKRMELTDVNNIDSNRKSTGANSPSNASFPHGRRRLRAWFSGEGQQALALRHHDAAALGDTARRSSNDSEHA